MRNFFKLGIKWKILSLIVILFFTLGYSFIFVFESKFFQLTKYQRIQIQANIEQQVQSEIDSFSADLSYLFDFIYSMEDPTNHAFSSISEKRHFIRLWIQEQWDYLRQSYYVDWYAYGHSSSGIQYEQGYEDLSETKIFKQLVNNVQQQVLKNQAKQVNQSFQWQLVCDQTCYVFLVSTHYTELNKIDSVQNITANQSMNVSQNINTDQNLNVSTNAPLEYSYYFIKISLNNWLRHIAERLHYKVSLALLSDQGQQHFLKQWNRSINNISHINVMPAVLELGESRELSSLQNQVAFDFDDVLYFAKQFKVQLGNVSLDAISLYDFTENHYFYDKLLRSTVFLAKLFLLIICCVFFFLVWSPIRGLKKSLVHLPRMQSGVFKLSKASLFKKNTLSSVDYKDNDQYKKGPMNQPRSLSQDVLNNSSVKLYGRLDTLEKELVKQQYELKVQTKALDEETAFVSCLLDTAHALIMTHNGKGELTMLNSFAGRIIGPHYKSFLGKPFSNLFKEGTMLSDTQLYINELYEGDRSEYSHEGVIESINIDNDANLETNQLLVDIEALDDVQKEGTEQAKITTKVVGNDHGKASVLAFFHSRLPHKDEYGYQVLTVALDISQRIKAEEHLAWLASHDPLTGLTNRRRFSEDLTKIIQLAEKGAAYGAVMFIDLDQFKDVNDTSGHHIGDKLLIQVADILKKSTRSSDVVARLGGDEFALILKECNENFICTFAETLCNNIRQIEVYGEDSVHRGSVSVGIVLYPKHGTDKEKLLANADIAMYKVKELGRNAWRLYNEEDALQSAVKERVFWNEKVRDVLKSGNFDVEFQPIVDVKSMDIEHYEVLLRVQDQDIKHLSPQKFILSAERSGRIHDLDRSILERVFQYKYAQELVGVHVRLAVNLSGVSFKSYDLVDYIAILFSAYPVKPSEIVFEITETAAVEDGEMTKDIMNAIRHMGCRFALDDFGVGFSSLLYLKQFPFDYVKIDGHFVKDLVDDMDDQVMVKALVDVAQAFGQFTIAEFVESKAVMDLLNTLNVDFAQGYYIGKSKPFNHFWPNVPVIASNNTKT